VWFDGANGVEYTGKKQVFDWNLFFATVKKYQPQALMACSGPDIRWAGNENGTGNTTEWSPQPSFMNLSAGGGVLTWYPSECDVSIRPGWFYHASEDGLIKSVPQLVDIFMRSVGRNSNLLLNVPPDRHGVISDADVSALKSWRTSLNTIFGNDLLQHQFIQSSNTRENKKEFSPGNCVDDDENTFWTTDKGVHSAQLTVDLGGVQTVNVVKLEEAIQYGQRISAFTLYADQGGQWVPITTGTTVGRTRILTFAPVKTVQLRLSIDDAKASPTLRTFSAYLILR
jgi:alpha-L-fucosidase